MAPGYRGAGRAGLALAMALAALPAAAQMGAPCASASAEQIAHLNDRWNATLAAGRPGDVEALYADDAVLVTAADAAPRIGRASIRAHLAEFRTRHPHLAIAMRSVTVGCNVAAVDGTSTFRVTGRRKGTRMFVGGRTSTRYEHRDGAWLIVRQELELTARPNRQTALAR
jgi:uncharacterized protein (TIGR02246 family)